MTLAPASDMGWSSTAMAESFTTATVTDASFQQRNLERARGISSGGQ
jgi:hypothetical protein